MTFAVIEADSVWQSRMAAGVIRPAMFVYLEWPTGPVFASTHHKTVTTTDQAVSPSGTEQWAGVGNLALIEAPEYRRNSALMTYRIGLTSLPQKNVNDATEASAIGRRAKLFLGLADESWGDWKLKLIFIGHIISAGDFRHRRDEKGDWLTDATTEISNGRSPRRELSNHHSPETAELGDTAMRLLPSAGRAVTWPN